MIQLVKINLETGMWIEDMPPVESIPLLEDGAPDPQYQTPPPPGSYRYWPKIDLATGIWGEGGTAPDPVTPEPTELECVQYQLSQTNADLMAFMDYYFSINPE